MIAHLCGKAVPTARLRAAQSQFAKTPIKSASTSTLGRFAPVDAVEPDMQLFHDALAVHGIWQWIVFRNIRWQKILKASFYNAAKKVNYLN